MRDFRPSSLPPLQAWLGQEGIPRSGKGLDGVQASLQATVSYQKGMHVAWWPLGSQDPGLHEGWDGCGVENRVQPAESSSSAEGVLALMRARERPGPSF